MLKLNGKFDYNGLMDIGCIEICNAMNSLPGIETTSSCCGHNKCVFNIFFKVNKNENEGLFFLLRCISNRYWKYGNRWTVEMEVGDRYFNNELPVCYMLISKDIIDSNEVVAQTNSLIENMNDHINHENFVKEYNLHINKFKVGLSQ